MHPLSRSSDLWILPTPRKSGWFSRVDWYLNWQMCKALSYPGLHLPSETLRLAQDYEVDLETSIKSKTLPLMVITGGLVPAKLCVVVESSDTREWLQEACAIAEKVQAKKVHVFLPSGIDEEEADRIWPKKFNGEVVFSADKEATS